MRRLLALGVLGASFALTSFAHAQGAPEPYPQPQPGYAQPGYPQPGYAQPGYPPPGYGAAPGYAPPPGYYVPVAPMAAAQGPKYLDYEEGQQIPAGYHLRTRSRKGMVIAGASLLGAFYLLSLASALTLSAVDDANNRHTNRALILTVPVAGPWIGMSSLHPDTATASFGLGILGVGETLGAALLVAGIALPKTELVRNDVGKPRLTLQPVLAFDHIGVKGAF